MHPPGLKNIIERVKEIASVNPDLLVVIVFGSAVQGRLTLSSDIDIAVAAETPLSLSRRLELIGVFSNSLGYETDLVDLQSVSGIILQQALCKGVFVRKDPDVCAMLIKKMLFNQADMMPLTTMILKAQGQRFVHGSFSASQ